MKRHVIMAAFLAIAYAASAGAAAPAQGRAVGFVDRQVQGNILLIQGYITAHGAENGFVYPTRAMVKKGGGLAAPIWPDNPWTGRTMVPGTTRGTYTYTLTSADRSSYKLVGHLSKGSFKVTGRVPKWLTAERNARRDKETELGARILQGYVEMWKLLHLGVPPSAPQMTPEGEVRAARFWPDDPYASGTPMGQGTAAGEFSYAPGAGGAYTLTAHLSGGATIDLSGAAR